MDDWWQLLVAGLGGGGLAGVAGSIITGMLQRPKVRADVVSVLTDAALKQVNELQERTAEAEREARATRDELTTARQKCRELAAELDEVLATLRAWRAAILSPTADLPALREMVTSGGEPGRNGRPH